MNMDTGKARQQGVASIEFAFMFVIVFAVFYGMISYVIPLLLLSSYNEISAEAVRASALIPVTHEDYPAQVRQTVQDIIDESWLGSRNADWKDQCEGYEGYVAFPSDGTFPPDGISVCIAHNAPAQIIPPITLFNWTFPQLPDALIGEASIQLR